MNLNKNLIILSVGLLFAGCYTQFSSFEQIPTNQQYGGTPGDTLKNADSSKVRVDTVVTKDREVCVWERDLMGYPQLRCFESDYYSNSWYDYNYTPWWYRYNPYWSGYDRHRRYYYDNPYYSDYHGGGGRGAYPNDGDYGKAPSRNRSSGLNTTPGSSSYLNKTDTQQPTNRGSEPYHRNRSEGLSGLPQGNNNLQKSTSNENQSNVQSNSDSGTQGNNTPVTTEKRQDRRNSRSRF